MRRYGLLLHISSLPSAWGIGDLGPAAHAFAHLLQSIGASVWQFLPLNPTSTFIGNSPYSSPSAFAGNPLFISPELLMRDGYLSYGDLDASLSFIPASGLSLSPGAVDFTAVSEHRRYLLKKVFERNCHTLESNPEYRDFCRMHHFWLHDYARFVSMKEAFDGAAWFCWPECYARRDPATLENWDRQSSRAMEREKFIQFLFFSQWMELRRLCNSAGVSLLADIPIYVTHDSADVWANPCCFNLGPDLRPVAVAGVPPDYFSPVGQRWGNPVYNWDALERDDFSWWKQRLGHSLLMADSARLDHFRGFCGYWEIPAEEETAVNGEWRPAPGKALFQSLQKHFGSLPFLAEDLGVITPDVRQLMREFTLPGMHVLQFAFGGGDFAWNPDVPHLHKATSYVYTGTHDNTTTRDWWAAHSGEDEKANLCAYSACDISEETASASLARLAFASVAECAILPVQDALNLDGEARMNTPGIAHGNWAWRMSPEMMDAEGFRWLLELARVYGRLPR